MVSRNPADAGVDEAVAPKVRIIVEDETGSSRGRKLLKLLLALLPVVVGIILDRKSKKAHETFVKGGAYARDKAVATKDVVNAVVVPKVGPAAGKVLDSAAGVRDKLPGRRVPPDAHYPTASDVPVSTGAPAAAPGVDQPKAGTHTSTVDAPPAGRTTK